MDSNTLNFDSNPFQQLLQLEALCRANAINLPAQRDSAHSWSGVGFRLGNQRYVVPFNEVAEVLYEPRATLLPGVKSWIKGISNVRGRLLPIVDLCGFLNTTLQANNKSRRVIVVELDEIFVGFLVDEVYGMQHFLIESYQEKTVSTLPNASDYLHGAFQNENHWLVFSLHQLVKSAAFFDVIA